MCFVKHVMPGMRRGCESVYLLLSVSPRRTKRKFPTIASSFERSRAVSPDGMQMARIEQFEQCALPYAVDASSEAETVGFLNVTGSEAGMRSASGGLYQWVDLVDEYCALRVARWSSSKSSMTHSLINAWLDTHWPLCTAICSEAFLRLPAVRDSLERNAWYARRTWPKTERWSQTRRHRWSQY